MVCKRRLLGTYSLFPWFVSPGQLAGFDSVRREHGPRVADRGCLFSSRYHV